MVLGGTVTPGVRHGCVGSVLSGWKRAPSAWPECTRGLTKNWRAAHNCTWYNKSTNSSDLVSWFQKPWHPPHVFHPNGRAEGTGVVSLPFTLQPPDWIESAQLLMPGPVSCDRAAQLRELTNRDRLHAESTACYPFPRREESRGQYWEKPAWRGILVTAIVKLPEKETQWSNESGNSAYDLFLFRNSQ